MTNPALQWISDAHIGGYLRATFIDCQNGEYKRIEDKTSFTIARNFLYGLRDQKVPISHFLYSKFEPESLEPFQYKGAHFHRFSNREIDFEAVIPNQDELVYPKRTFNGFKNPYSKAVVGNFDRNPSPDQKSVLIGAGFTARCCLLETMIGSFERAANPDNHYAIIALGATNVHPDYYGEYITDFLAQADENIRDRIGFAVVEKILSTLTRTLTPSRSSQAHPYKVSAPRG